MGRTPCCTGSRPGSPQQGASGNIKPEGGQSLPKGTPSDDRPTRRVPSRGWTNASVPGGRSGAAPIHITVLPRGADRPAEAGWFLFYGSRGGLVGDSCAPA